MSEQTMIFLAVFVAAISTGAGALPVLFKKDYSQKFIDIAMGFSAGVMLSASFISLILPGIEISKENGHWAGIWVVVLGVALGHITTLLFHEKMPHDGLRTSSQNTSSAFLIVSAIALHNFPEGLAVGVGFGVEDLSRGLLVALAISIQNMPEGLVVALAFIASGFSRGKALLYAFLAGMVEPIGAVIGLWLTQAVVHALPFSLGFAAGAMIFVVGYEIIPATHKSGHGRPATHGLVAGVCLLCLLDALFTA